MNIGANAMIGLHDCLFGITYTLMNLVTLTWLTIKLEADLTGGLLCAPGGVDGQQSKTRQTGYRTFHTIRIIHRKSQHLITTTDTYHHLTIAMGAHDSLCTTVPTQLQQVVEG